MLWYPFLFLLSRRTFFNFFEKTYILLLRLSYNHGCTSFVDNRKKIKCFWLGKLKIVQLLMLLIQHKTKRYVLSLFLSLYFQKKLPIWKMSFTFKVKILLHNWKHYYFCEYNYRGTKHRISLNLLRQLSKTRRLMVQSKNISCSYIDYWFNFWNLI